MPAFFRKEFRLKGGTTAHIRKKENGTYEIRYRRNGMNISASAKNLEQAKERFIEALCKAKSNESTNRVFFSQFAQQWLEVVKKPVIKENTYNNYVFTFKTYILPIFGKLRLRDIKPMNVQRLLNDLEKKKIYRSQENVYVLLKALFDFAVAENLITKSPMAPIRKPKHETQHGQALTVEEEHKFVKACINSHAACKYAYILMLYTGIRRSEFHSENFCSMDQRHDVQNSERHATKGTKNSYLPHAETIHPFYDDRQPERLRRNAHKRDWTIASGTSSP